MPKNSKTKSQKKKKGGKSAGKSNGGRGRQKGAPIATSRIVTTVHPNVNGRSSTIIRHREYVDQVEMNQIFEAVSYRINPGNINLFPWLSTVACCFETYRFKRLVFDYVPSVPTTEQGNVLMSIDYDCLDAVPTDEASMMENKSAKMGRLYAEMSSAFHPADAGALGQRRYVLGSDSSTTGVTYPAHSDARAYNVGYFTIATVGATGEHSSQQCGTFFVSYEIELFTPQKPEIPTTERDWIKFIPIPGGGSTPIFSGVAGKLLSGVYELGAHEIKYRLKAGIKALLAESFSGAGFTGTAEGAFRFVDSSGEEVKGPQYQSRGSARDETGDAYTRLSWLAVPVGCDDCWLEAPYGFSGGEQAYGAGTVEFMRAE